MSINILIVLNTFLILIFSFLFNNLKMVLWEYEYRSDSIAIHPCNFNCGSYERPAITATPAAKRQTRVPRLRLIETSGRLVNHHRTFTQVRYSRSKVHFSLRPQLLARVAGSPREDCKKIISLSLFLASRFDFYVRRNYELWLGNSSYPALLIPSISSLLRAKDADMMLILRDAEIFHGNGWFHIASRKYLGHL